MELVTRTIGQNNLEVLEDFTAHGITVPKGFIFDGASAPRLFWNIIPPYKGTAKAAVVHDWNCKNAKSKEERKEADRLFFTMLRENGISLVRSTIGYLGVRIGAFLGVGVHYGK